MTIVYTAELNEDELNMIAYSLEERANKLAEQSLDRQDNALGLDAVRHRTLATEIRAITNP